MLMIDKKSINRLPALQPAEVYEMLETRTIGLTKEEVKERQQLYGKNELPQPITHSLWRQLFEQFSHFMALLLWIAGLLAFMVDMPELGWATWAVVIINGSFSFWQEYRADQALSKLADMLPRKVKVYRDGRLEIVQAEDITVGDIMVLESGDHISADARIVEADELSVDLSLLTGESLQAERSALKSTDINQPMIQHSNLLFAGTTVVAGRGVAAVYAIGKQTEFGKVAKLTADLSRGKSALELQVQRIVHFISGIAMLMGGGVFAMAAWWVGMDLREAFLLGIGIIVANVPEGLLPTVSLSLAVGVRRMAKQNALVRRLSAVEALSATTMICTDKTGTITLNEVTVKKIWLPDCEIQITGSGYDKQGEIVIPSNGARKQIEILLTIGTVCSEADIVTDEKHPQSWKIIGDPTEAALLVATSKGGFDVPAVRACFTRQLTIPFDSRRKMMSIVVKNHTHSLFGSNESITFVKGAPLEVLNCCRFIMKDGTAAEFIAQERERIMENNDRLAGLGHRVLALAYQVGDAENRIEQDLIFAGLAAMIDPPRPEVAEAVASCRQAGIRITMITGDYGLTAEAIGRQIGLVDQEADIVTGSQFEELDEKGLHHLLEKPNPIIFARTNPEHKLKIVEAYKSLGHIVAVTGDGVNDAPALRAAHIGIAMGRGGTDVAREVADIVLLDDNFATIVKAIEQGRAIYDNIRKFITYILSSNIPEIVPFIVMIFAKIPPALNILQILIIDIGTDMLPALALGAEKPETGIMQRQPRSYRGDLLDRSLLLRSYGFLGIIEAVLSMGAFFSVWIAAGYNLAAIQQVTPQILHNTADPSVIQVYQHATTMTLAAIIACQMGNLFVCRSEYIPFWRLSFMDNWFIWTGIVTEIAVAISIIYLPVLTAIFMTQPLTIYDVGLLTLCPMILVSLEELRRWGMRRETKGC